MPPPGAPRAAIPYRPVFLASLLALAGCEFMGTREFSSKPSEARSLPGFSKPGDSAAFRVVESLWEPGRKTASEILAEKRITFTFVKDSADGAENLQVLDMRVTDAESGALLEKSRRVVRPGGAVESLPLFAQGLDTEAASGALEVSRRLDGEDTLEYRGRLEESWRVAETVAMGGAALARGTYWYGASGLIKAEQAWEGFEPRGTDGAARPGAGPSGTQALRRSLERL